VKGILIVDDSSLVRRCLRTFLETHTEWNVCGEAENGRDAIDQAQRLHPDLILLDSSMPVMNGFQAAHELHKLMPEVPLLMFTTFGSSHLEREAKASGIAAVRSKSEALHALVSSIHDLLESDSKDTSPRPSLQSSSEPNTPITCPVCGVDHIEPVRRRALANTPTISGVLGFRCGNGHIFLWSTSNSNWKPAKADQESDTTE
jgi:DNA-binding NarL/FixJ family response regulator